MAVYGELVNDMMTTYFSGKTIKAMLVTSAFTQVQAHDFRDDVTSESSGGGYVAGGATVTGVTFAIEDGNVVMHCDDVDFGAVTPADVAGIVFYVSTGSAATDRLIAADVFGPVDVESLATITYAVSAAGLVIIGL